MDMPVTLIVSYAVFSFLGFYQKLHIKNFKGGSQVFLLSLNLFTLIATVFGVGFLLYYGYRVSWVESAVLFGVALVIQFVWFPIEAKLGLRNSYFIFSLSGFLIMPICAYFMWASLP